jgi:hypothetical protein
VMDDLVLSMLTVQQRRVLQIMAEAGVVGASEEEVAIYLITRGIDDLMRDGVLKLGSEPV